MNKFTSWRRRSHQHLREKNLLPWLQIRCLTKTTPTAGKLKECIKFAVILFVINNCKLCLFSFSTNALMGGLASSTDHFFEILSNSSPYTPELKSEVKTDDTGHSKGRNPIMYGSGIRCQKQSRILIGGILDMCQLGTILDQAEEKFDGITSPYIYAATSHSFFPWHIEDMALCSLNYLFVGASKIW